jgi:large subunit ribosomal protein LP0
MATKKSNSRKVQLAEELEAHFDNYKSVLIVEADNVGSNQLHEIRKAMRGTALIYCGKNTQMRRVLRKLEENGRPELEKLRQALKLNVALVFTNDNLADVKKAIEENKLPASARAGSIAQCAVVIPAGVTSLEPTQTSFLQALNIGSKITKGMIEIIAEVRLFEEGDKVDGSQAALLQKMDIQPFAYGLVCIKVFDDGSLFDPEVLDITEEQVISIFKTGVKNIAAVCIECEMPTMASVSYSILLAYANLLAVACETDYSFKQAEAVRAALGK